MKVLSAVPWAVFFVVLILLAELTSAQVSNLAVPTAPSPVASGSDAPPALPDAPSSAAVRHRYASVVDGETVPRLTPGGKFQVFLRKAFDPTKFLLVAAQAGVTQAADRDPGFGQGAEGYGKRYGAAFADQVSNNFFTSFVYASLLKEDPRYFRMVHGLKKRRFVYALKQELICHTDAGGRTFAWKNVLGPITSGALSTAYYPEEERNVGHVFERAGIGVAFATAGGVISEFWPDLRRVLHLSHDDR